MSFESALKRAGRILGGFFGAAGDAVQFAGDLTLWSDEERADFYANVDEYGLIGGLAESAKGGTAQGTQMAQHLFGPDQGFGAAIGAIPKPVRGQLEEKVLKPLEKTEYLANRALAAGAVAATAGAQGNPTSFADAWEISDDFTAGQAIMLGINGADPLDPAAKARLEQQPTYSLTTGAIDGLLLWFVPGPEEYLAFGARGAKAARAARKVPNVGGSRVIDNFIEADRSWIARGSGNVVSNIFGTGSDVGQRIRDYAVGSGFQRWETFRTENLEDIDANNLSAINSKIDDVAEEQANLSRGITDPDEATTASDIQTRQAELEQRRATLEYQRDRMRRDTLAARIHDRLGDHNVANGPLARALAYADDASQREDVWRLFAGEEAALTRLRQQNGALFSQIEDLKIRMATEANTTVDDLDSVLTQQRLANSDGLLASMKDEWGRLVLERDRLRKMEGYAGAAGGDALSAPGVAGRVKSELGSRIVDVSPITGRPRKLLSKMPAHWFDLHDSRFMSRVGDWLDDAGMSAEDVELWRGRLTGAQDPGTRWRILSNAEDAAVRKMAEEADVDPAVVDHVLAKAAEARKANRNLYRKVPKYGGVRLPDGEELIVESPITRQQMGDAYQPVDVEGVRLALDDFTEWADRNSEAYDEFVSALEEGKKTGKIEARSWRRRAFEAGSEAASGLMSFWKAGKVARGAYTARAMLLDEALRLFGHFETGATLAHLASGTGRVVGRFLEGEGGPRRVGIAAGSMAALAGAGATPAVGMAAAAYGAARVARIAGQSGVGQKLSRAITGGSEGFTSWLATQGTDLEAFGDTAQEVAAVRNRVSEFGSHTEMIAEGSRLARRLLDKGVERTGRFEWFDPKADDYAENWTRILNRQFRDDHPFRMAMEGKTEDEIAAWLRSEEGVKYRQGIDPDRDVEEWAAVIKGTERNLFGPSEDLRQIALKRDVTEQDLDEFLPASDRNAIHGEVVRELAEGRLLARAGKEVVNTLVDLFSTLPSEELLRVPFFQMRYRQVMAERIKAFERVGDGVTPDMMRRAKNQARDQAMKDMTDNMYSYADRTRFAGAMRYLSPFFSPMENAMRAWWGITRRNPVFVSRLVSTYRDAVENVTETKTEDGRTFEVVQVPDSIRDAIAKLPWMRHLPETVTVSPNAVSLNTMFQGPGLGPWTAALKPHVRGRPELEQQLKWMFPYGVGREPSVPGGDITEEFTPTVLARAVEQFSDGDKRARIENQLMQNAKSEMLQGLRPEIGVDDPGWDELVAEVERKADALMALDVLSRNWMPATTQTGTWAEPYIRAMRTLREEDPATAQQKFIDQYGEEFLPVVQSVYESNLSLPANQQAFEALTDRDSPTGKMLARAAKDDPALARFVVGSVGAGGDGDWSIEHWSRMKDIETFEGSGEMVVEVERNLDEAFQETDVTQGWKTYLAYMDAVDQKIEENGYTSLYSEDAAWLYDNVQEARRKLADEYPGWWEDYQQPQSRNVWTVREDMLRDMAFSRPFAGRPGMKSLRTYIQGRDSIAERLEGREASTLSAQANADLAVVWQEFVSKLVIMDPSFAETYHYLLENTDPFNEPVEVQEGEE